MPSSAFLKQPWVKAHPYRVPLKINEVVEWGVELNADLFRLRPSIVYIREWSASRLELALDKRNEEIPFERACVEKYPSQRLATQYSDL